MSIWSLSSYDLKFYYNSGDRNSQNTVLLENFGGFTINFNFTFDEKTFAVSPTSGILFPGKTQNITIMVKTTLADALSAITISNVNDTYRSCYSPMLVKSELVNIDCTIKDIMATRKECNGYRSPVVYSYKPDSICQKGLALPKDDALYCSKTETIH